MITKYQDTTSHNKGLEGLADVLMLYTDILKNIAYSG